MDLQLDKREIGREDIPEQRACACACDRNMILRFEGTRKRSESFVIFLEVDSDVQIGETANEGTQQTAPPDSLVAVKEPRT